MAKAARRSKDLKARRRLYIADPLVCPACSVLHVTQAGLVAKAARRKEQIPQILRLLRLLRSDGKCRFTSTSSKARPCEVRFNLWLCGQYAGVRSPPPPAHSKHKSKPWLQKAAAFTPCGAWGGVLALAGVWDGFSGDFQGAREFRSATRLGLTRTATMESSCVKLGPNSPNIGAPPD